MERKYTFTLCNPSDTMIIEVLENKFDLNNPKTLFSVLDCKKLGAIIY